MMVVYVKLKHVGTNIIVLNVLTFNKNNLCALVGTNK